MNDNESPRWRQGYDTVEKQLAPGLSDLLQSEQFAVAAGLLARLQRALQDQGSRTTRRLLHGLNLPAGSDVTRILQELGQLQRQIRELAAQLDAHDLSDTNNDAPRATASPRISTPNRTKQSAAKASVGKKR